MGNKYFKGFMLGTMIGVAAGMFILPQLNTATRRRIMRTGQSVMNKAGETVNNMMNMND